MANNIQYFDASKLDNTIDNIIQAILKYHHLNPQGYEVSELLTEFQGDTNALVIEHFVVQYLNVDDMLSKRAFKNNVDKVNHQFAIYLYMRADIFDLARIVRAS